MIKKGKKMKYIIKWLVNKNSEDRKLEKTNIPKWLDKTQVGIREIEANNKEEAIKLFREWFKNKYGGKRYNSPYGCMEDWEADNKTIHYGFSIAKNNQSISHGFSIHNNF